MLSSLDLAGNQINAKGVPRGKCSAVVWFWSFWYHFHLTTGSITAIIRRAWGGTIACKSVEEQDPSTPKARF
jgi:hypothetical protein